MKNYKRAIWIFTLILIVIEQGIKVVININYLEANIPILAPWVYFKPMFNRDYSWLNSMLQLGVGKWVHIMIVSAIILMVFLFYNFVSMRLETTLLVDSTFALLFSAAICSLIDKVIWDGSLDYIFINGFFTFDLKDVYINICIGLVLLILFTDHQGIRTILDETK